MRIDKYLKVTRLIKRRTVAKEACDQGRILVNGKAAKPGTELKIGDKVELNFGASGVNIEVVELKEHVLKDDATNLYRIIN